MASRRLLPKRQLRLLLLLLPSASRATAGVLGDASGSSSSSSSSSSVGYCDDDDLTVWVSSPMLSKCREVTSYNLTSGVKPTLNQALDLCDSSCYNLFQLGWTSIHNCTLPFGACSNFAECRLPFGDHIFMVADLIDYVVDACSSRSASNSNSNSNSNSVGSSVGSSDKDGTEDNNDTPSGSSPASLDRSSNKSAAPIAIGSGVGAGALIALITWLCWRRQRQRHKSESTNASTASKDRYMPMLSDVNEFDDHRLLDIDLPRQQRPHSDTAATNTSTTSSVFSSALRNKRARLFDLTPWRVDVDSIQDIGRIGTGAHCVVWRVLYRSSLVLASKRIQTDQVSVETTQSFVDEVFLMSHLQHPNIVAFMGAAWTKETDLQVLLEFMDVGNLRDYLLRAETPRVWTLQKLSIAHDIVQALVYVHSFQPPLLHRDLKSHNVMLTTNGFQDGDPRATMVVQTALTAKLTDFGVSRFHSENNTMTIGVGTSRWLAPEVIVGETNYGPEADVYSFGVVLSELDTHALPYDDEQTEDGESLANVAILQRVALGELKPAFNTKTCIPELLALAQRCLQHDASKRPSAPMVAYELRTMMKAMRR